MNEFAEENQIASVSSLYNNTGYWDVSDELNNIKGGNKTGELVNWSLIILDEGIKNTFNVTIPAARSYREIAT